MEDRKTNSDTDKLSLPLTDNAVFVLNHFNQTTFFFLKINLTMHYT